MSVDDQLAERLAEWLHEAAPEPPRLLTAADIERNAAASRRRARATRRRISFPVLAAACVVLAAVLAVTLSSGSDRPAQPGSPAPTSPPYSAPAHPSPSNSSPSKVITTPAPVTPAPFAGLPDIWRRHVVPIRIAPLNLYTMIAGAKVAYVRQATSAGHDQLLAIDPRTGTVVASAALPGGQGQPPGTTAAALAGGRVWVAQPRPAAMQWWDPDTLAERGSVALHGAGPITDFTAQGALVYVAQPDRVTVIDTSSGRVVQQIPFATSAIETRLSVSPDGTRLYVGTSNGSGFWSLTVLDTHSGAVLAGPVRPGGNGVGALLATDSGVYAEQGYGMSADLRFFSTQALTAGGTVYGREIEGGSGTLPLGAWLVGGTVYTTSPGEVACRVPDTAQARASQATHGKQYYTDFARVDGELLALWQPETTRSQGQTYLVRITPPAACR